MDERINLFSGETFDKTYTPTFGIYMRLIKKYRDRSFDYFYILKLKFVNLDKDL